MSDPRDHPDAERLAELKADVRTEVSEDLARLGHDGVVAASRAIVEKLLAGPLSERRGPALIFLPIRRPGASPEPDLSSTIEWTLGRLFVPKVDWQDRSMEAIPWSSGVGTGRHGVPEPRGQDAIAPEALDLVLVPGVAFDREGARLGRGGGFYDRYLARIDRTRTAVVGVCFEMQIRAQVPCEAHDARMDAVVTEA